MKHAGGRPKGSTKYNPRLADKLEAYIDDCRSRRLIPWIQEFCLKNNHSRRTFYHWTKKHKELDEARDHLMGMQKLTLKKFGLSGKGNVRTIIYLLRRNHGMREAKPETHRPGIKAVF